MTHLNSKPNPSKIINEAYDSDNEDDSGGWVGEKGEQDFANLGGVEVHWFWACPSVGHDHFTQISSFQNM